jgi:hypothetical protein
MLCQYNCGRKAKYTLKNGKRCCSISHNKCEAIKNKNSKGLKSAYQNGKRKYKYSELMNWRKNKDSFGYKKWIDYVINEVFILNPIVTADHKKLLVEMFDWSYECLVCNNKGEWNNIPLVLHLDHKNGNNRDFRFKNLRFLCPNCHSQTETYCGKNINIGIKKVSDEILINSLKSSPNIYQALLKVSLSPKGGNYNRANKLISEHSIKFKGE